MGIFAALLRQERETLLTRCTRSLSSHAESERGLIGLLIDAWCESLETNEGDVSPLAAPALSLCLSTRQSASAAAWAPKVQAELWTLAVASGLTPSTHEALRLAELVRDTAQLACQHEKDVARLTQAEQHLRRVLGMTEVGWFDWNVQTDRVEMSEQMRKQWQTPGDAPIASALDRIHPDDRERVRALIRDAIERRVEFVTHYRLLFEDGHIRWIDARGRVFYDETQRPLNFVGTSIDITESKQHEEHQHNERQWLETVLARLPVPVIMVEPKTGSHTFVNQAADHMLGGKKYSSDSGQAYEELYDVRDWSGRRLSHHETPSYRSANGELLQNYEVTLKSNDNEYDLLFSSVFIPAMFGRKGSIICLCQDVTSLKTYQRHLQQLVDTWRQDRQQLDKYIATLLHDVRTPLSAASLAAQLAERLVERDVDKAKKNIVRVEANLRRLDDMLRRLLDSQSGQADGTMALHRQPARLDQMLEEGVRELNHIHHNRIQFENGIGEAELDCDEQALRRVLDNLVNNAVKYGHAESPISVRVMRSRGRVSLQVHNEGPVIAAADQEALFAPFYRSKGAEQSKQQGWGLGLSAVYDIARAHGGNVCLSSSVQGGTTFDVSFPVVGAPS